MLSGYLGWLRVRRRPASGWRVFAVLVPVFVATQFEESSDVSWYLRMLLAVLGAALPLVLVLGVAAEVDHRVAEHRARRLMPHRPKAVYLLLALGWALGGAASALAAWAAGARPTGPGVGEDWIATGLVWATMISACATLMMLGCALTAVAPERTQA